MKLVNLFLIEAPFQLVSATQAVKCDPEGARILIVRRTGLTKNDKQVTAVLENVKDQWDTIIHVDTTNLFKLIYDLLSIKLRLLFSWNKVNVLALGDFRSLFGRIFCKCFSYNNLWFLDDGIASLDLFHEQDGEIKLKPKHLQSKKIEGYYRSIDSINTPRITLKTFLDVKSEAPFFVEHVNLTDAFLKDKMKKRTFDDNLVFFLGAKLVEAGFLDKKAYFGVCEKVAKTYENKKIVYVPHRQECQSSIAEIVEHFKFDVLELELPVEFYLCGLDCLPRHVVSVCSAALCTIPEIFPEIRVGVVDFERTNMAKTEREGFDLCYSYLFFKSKANMLSEKQESQSNDF